MYSMVLPRQVDLAVTNTKTVLRCMSTLSGEVTVIYIHVFASLL